MASFISTVKRKLSAFLTSGSSSEGVTTLESEESRPQKRQRRDSAEQECLRQKPRIHRTQTPMLISTPHIEPTGSSLLLPPAFSPLPQTESFASERAVNNEPSKLFLYLSNDVLSRCLSYVATKSDRFSLQTTCKTFRRLSDSDDMLANIDLGCDWTSVLNVPPESNHRSEIVVDPNMERRSNQNADDINIIEMTIAFPHGRLISSDRRGIITDSDTSVTACSKLMKFAAAGNWQAIYMTAMILCYCHENISEGIALLRLASDAGHLRSTYALALILRDCRQTESDQCLSVAAEGNYPPAWQEKLSATEMRTQFGGDLDASRLIHYLDPSCLTRLLGRHYLECHRVRKNQTSHCWNPLCGRWAYKATSPIPQRRNHQRRGMDGLLEPFYPNDANDSPGDVDNSNDLNNDELEGIFRNRQRLFSIESILPPSPMRSSKNYSCNLLSAREKIRQCLENKQQASSFVKVAVARMKMCSSCRRAKYCSKLCQVYDWRSGRHKMECQFL